MGAIPILLLGSAGGQSYPDGDSQFAKVPPKTGGDYRGYLNGSLTWEGAEGGIIWSTSDGQEPAGPAHSSSFIVGSELGWLERSLTGKEPQGTTKIPVDVFKSQPIPHRLFLNASKHVLLLLFTKDCAADFVVELYADETLLAGAVPAQDPAQTSDNDPDGFLITEFSMQPELDVLEKDTILILKLLYYRSDKTYMDTPRTECLYGLDEPQRSRLALPGFTAEDLLVRVPEYASPGSEAPGGEARDEFGGVGALLFAIGAAAIRRRTRVALVLCVLVAGAFSGCLDSSTISPAGSLAPSSTGKVDSSFLEDQNNETGLVGKSVGAIGGVVRNDVDQTLSGVIVSILHNSNFVRTDTYGRFAFGGLAPGTYKVRFDRDTYQSLETPAEVVAGSLTRLDVQLFPTDYKGADFRPHRHDLWPGPVKDVPVSTVLFETQITASSGLEGGLICKSYSLSAPSYCGATVPIERNEKNPNVILPGTRDVEIAIDWDPELNPNLERAGVIFVSPDFQQMIPMYPRPRGEPTHIRTGWEMSDDGHASWTSWWFWIYVPDNGGNRQGVLAKTYRPGGQLVRGEFDVSIRIHKGIVPLEREHRDFWNGSLTLEIPLRQSNNGWTPDHGALIPPETLWIEAKRIDLPTDSDLGGDLWGDVTGVIPDEREWGVAYSAGWGESIMMTEVGREDDARIFHAKLEEHEPDDFYSINSRWRFDTDVISKQDDFQAVDENSPITNTRPRSDPPNLKIIAHRDPYPTVNG